MVPEFGQNLKYFEIWLQYWKILQQIAKRRTFGCNIEKYCNRGGATEGHGACYIDRYMIFSKMIFWSIYAEIFHFLSDIWKFLFSKFMHISVEISYKILIFSYIGQYNIISVDIWWHIPIIYVFIYRAL